MAKEIHAKATAGVYSEVMKQIYDSLDKRIREAVSNAIDAKATMVKISVFISNNSKFTIYDNGIGMSEDDLVDKYVCMGGGDNYNNEDTIGRIGIGALSIFAVGDTVTITTRKKGSDKVVIAELDLDKLKNETEHSTPLEDIKLGYIKGQRTATKEDEAHFTEIAISDLSRTTLDIFNDANKTKKFIERIERILPVPYRGDDAIFEKIPQQVTDRITSQKFSIDVLVHIPHLGYPNYKICRQSISSIDNIRIVHYPPIFPFNIEGGSHSNLTVYGYLYINAEKVLPEGWRGVNARVKNVTIESNTYFGYEDDPASRNRIGGEVFIDNIDENNAIITNRSGFTVENPDYLLISEYIKGRIEEAQDIVRRHSVVDSIVKKLINALKSLRTVFERNASIQEERSDSSTFKELDDATVTIEKDTLFSLENSLKSELDKKHIEFELIWSTTLEAAYDIEPQEDQFYTIYVHSDLREFLFNVAGKSIEYLITHCGDGNPILIKKPGKVYLNLDSKMIPNKDITKVESGYVETVLALYLNYLRCNKDADVLYAQTMHDLLALY